MLNSEIHQLSALQLLRLYQQKKLSPVEVLESTFERIGQLNPDINALYYLDQESAISQARRSEQRWLKGKPLGLLDGIHTSVKDALPVSGMPVFRGSAAMPEEGVIADEDCPAVARMKEHGMVIYGKNTMCDFGILPAGYSSRHGITRNPVNLSYNTGGSSSGATAAVAAGFEPLSLGTDIVGSIRLPASFCGIYGFKPSQGRVPYYFPNNPSLVAGPLTRTVSDAALMMNVIARPDDRDFTALPYDATDYLHGLADPVDKGRIGVITDLGLGIDPDPEVVKRVTEAAEFFAGQGFDVAFLDAPFKKGDDACAERYYQVRCFSEFNQCDPARKQRAEVINEWSSPVPGYTAEQHYNDWFAMQKLREQTMALIQNFDFLILPSVPVPAYRAELPAADTENLFAPWANNFLFNLTGQPGASIPCGETQAGLPVGLQIIGRSLDDQGVLKLSAFYEKHATTVKH
ncbi:amidase family protein [Endozoicomonas arenosclerae]|uniref:amidase family protein n=1 Tax=Endozoicomonas arenosclerae TaxID=1633495 RepID=UPI000785836D|nr:amidase family protein [Endozoicomonas arenosclerae]